MVVESTLTVNGRRIAAKCGRTLVDAALAGGVVIPTDCSSGQCDTCRVSVISGEIDAAGTQDGETVLACQARVCGHAEITFDEFPPAARFRGDVLSIKSLAPDVVEVEIRAEEALTHRPGQYAKITFPGCPARDYSPTAAVSDVFDSRILILHVRLYATGSVSNALRSKIRAGDRVGIDGPYGNAFYRPGRSRLVLVGTGTGWAPLWAIARAARQAEPHRSIKVVVGARDPRHLYMRSSLAWLSQAGVGDITLSCTGEPGDWSDVVSGRTTDFLTDLEPTDTVYAAGSAAMVSAVKRMSDEVGAVCYTDPFSSPVIKPSLFQRLRQALDTGDESHLHPGRSRVSNEPVHAADAVREVRGARPKPQLSRTSGGFTAWLHRS